MRIWILGAGNYGIQVAKHLRHEQHEIILLDKNPDQASLAMDKIDCHTQVCDGTDLRAYHKFGMNPSDAFIALTGSDEVNIVACSMVSSLFHLETKICKLSKHHHALGLGEDPKVFGIDYVVNPEIEVALNILSAVDHDAAGSAIRFPDSRYQIRDLEILHDSPLRDRCIKEIRERTQGDFIIPVIKRKQTYFIPKGDDKLIFGDVAYIFSDSQAYLSLNETKNGNLTQTKRRTLLLGSSPVVEHILDTVTKKRSSQGKNRWYERLFSKFAQFIDSDITLLESSPGKIEELRQRYQGIDIIPGSIKELTGLKANEYGKFNIAISASEIEDRNILNVIMAKQLGVQRGIGVINHPSFAARAQELGVDVPVSLRGGLADSISGLLRGNLIKNFHTIPGTSIAAIQILIPESFSSSMAELKDIKEFRGSLILSIRHETIESIPNGVTHLYPNDLLTLAISYHQIPKILTFLKR